MFKILKRSLFLNILLLVVALVVGYGAHRVLYQAVAARREASIQQEKIQSLLKKKAELEVYLDELKNSEAIRREAKERLNLKLPGEEVLVVVPDASSYEKPTEKNNFFINILEGLKKLFENIL